MNWWLFGLGTALMLVAHYLSTCGVPFFWTSLLAAYAGQCWSFMVSRGRL